MEDPSFSASRNGLRWQYCGKRTQSLPGCNPQFLHTKHDIYSASKAVFRLNQALWWKLGGLDSNCVRVRLLRHVFSNSSVALTVESKKLDTGSTSGTHKSGAKVVAGCVDECCSWTMLLFCCSIRFGANATRRHSQYLAFQTKSIQASTTNDTCGAACELGSGSFEGWMMKSEEKRELCRIAAISPFTLTASSFYKAQKKYFNNRWFFKLKKKSKITICLNKNVWQTKYFLLLMQYIVKGLFIISNPTFIVPWNSAQSQSPADLGNLPQFPYR